MTVVRTIQIVESFYTLIFFVSAILFSQQYLTLGIILLACGIYNLLGVVFYEFDGETAPEEYNPKQEIKDIIYNKLFHGMFVILCIFLFFHTENFYLKGVIFFFCCIDVFLSDKNVKLYVKLPERKEHD